MPGLASDRIDARGLAQMGGAALSVATARIDAGRGLLPTRLGRVRLLRWLVRTVRATLGLATTLDVEVPSADLATGLALHASAPLAAIDARADAEVEAALRRWLAPSPRLLRFVLALPPAERAAVAVRLLDGEPPEASGETELPGASSVDWPGVLARLQRAYGMSVADVQAMPWRAVPVLLSRAQALLAIERQDAALAASAGFGGGDAAEAIAAAVAALAGPLLPERTPSSPAAVRASLSRLAQLSSFTPASA